MIRPPPSSPLFPYTTLFRSQACRGVVDDVAGASIHYQVKFPETLVKIVVRDRDAAAAQARLDAIDAELRDRKSTRLNSSHVEISYAVFCLKKKKKKKDKQKQ